MFDTLNVLFGKINTLVSKVFFFDILFFIEDINLPLVLFVLLSGGVIFTLQMRFVNIRLFGKALHLVWQAIKKTKTEKKEGEISHFRALTTALSATVGLGNIAGVAIAISTGGPGATLWMIVMGFLGMSTKFTECTLGVMYREKRSDGQLLGGPMEYLERGLSELGRPKLGHILSLIFCVMCIGGSFGGGTAFQVNQSLHAMAETWPILSEHGWIYGLFMAVLVGLVIIKGIKNISLVASRVVPAMCLLYLLMAIVIIVADFDRVPHAFYVIIKGAFQPEAAFGGFLGVLVQGVRRAAFSNEAGLGSAPIAHSVAQVNHPVEEGVVALLEPFIDTVCICTITALVIVITGAYENPLYADFIQNNKGAALTSSAMGEVSVFFPYLLNIAVFLFAFSTIISWSYYGERCFVFLFGDKKSIIYKWFLLVIIFLGSVSTSTNALEFSDLMILGMAFPNLFGVFLLSKKVKNALIDYQQKFKK